MTIMRKLVGAWYYFRTHTVYKMQANHIGKRTCIFRPLQLDAISSVYLDDNVYIGEGAWIMGNGQDQSSLFIGRGTSIGHYVHIVAKHKVSIKENVLIADRVFISDCTHSYKNVNEPIISQGITQIGPVEIGEGSWIGENVCICGASIGKHSVIGANSVVNSDIPDYSIAVGTPARVIKTYSFEKEEWIKYE